MHAVPFVAVEPLGPPRTAVPGPSTQPGMDRPGIGPRTGRVFLSPLSSLPCGESSVRWGAASEDSGEIWGACVSPSSSRLAGLVLRAPDARPRGAHSELRHQHARRLLSTSTLAEPARGRGLGAAGSRCKALALRERDNWGHFTTSQSQGP